ncbi:CaiB/BaiF CoA transferase family protein [Kallipyga massiliensis]|uniref:CaiB/BaiF CoA transferase family protein n=1 Tax=Kallipyga massiliensis TaxID=1472764 RepID=UPI0004BB5014|nr:CoA transferase [Kallipyga massiliensis]
MIYGRALEDVTVLDLTRVVAGPFCGSILGDMGARVIKIEIPNRGDDSRAYGPIVNGESAYFALLNRSKYGVTLNLKSDAGKSMFLGLVKKADVVIENYRPGVMDKLGLGYDVLKEVNPRIIYGAVSGFGAWGPYSQRPGYDILAQAMGGLMSLTGEKGGQPTRAGNAMGDMLAGMNLTIGVLAALHARTLTGKGQRVDVSLVDSIVVSLENAFTRYWNTGELYERNGNAYAALAPYDTFEASDGLVVIACGNQSLYEKFCKKVANKLEWVEDSRFLTNILRVENMDALEELINSWSVHYTVEEITNRCLEAGVPAGPVYDLSQIVKDPHIVEARDMFPIVHHPVIGDMPVNGDAIKMSDTNPEIVKASPLLGEDNQSIYQEFLELSEEDLVRLKEEGVI